MDTTQFNMNLEVDVSINNKNIINPLTWTTMEALVQYQTVTIASYTETNGQQPRLTNSIKNNTMSWTIGVSGIASLQALLCNLDAIQSPSPLVATFGSSVSFLNLKYLLYTYSFPDLIQSKAIDLTNFCAATPDNCKINPTWRSKICL